MLGKLPNINLLRHALALCMVLMGLLVAPSAFGYQFITSGQCPNGSTWSSSRQPLGYYINQNGSSTVPMNTVKQIMADSFDAWSEPCCSSFSASYQGTTASTALNAGQNVVLSFQENNWPTQMGSVNQTIAVTLFQGNSNCTIYSAPIIFNAVGFNFCSSGNGCTDLQSIATHEIGHNLGLDHSNHQDATMFYAYSGGTGSRTLASDDIAGVCALYPGTCSCNSNSDCNTGQVCDNGQCEAAPCTNDGMCPLGKACNTSSGECVVPSCNSDSDCASGYICDSTDHCVTDCPTCRECTSQADCGGGGAYCAALQENATVGRCLTSCGPDGTCPGDSECFIVPNAPASSGSCTSNASCQAGEECVGDGNGGNLCVTLCTSDASCGSDQVCQNLGIEVCVDTYQLCLNPDAPTAGICPSGYECHADSGTGPTPTGACNGIGNFCSQTSNDCTSDNDICVGISATEAYCSCSCNSDADCGDEATCEAFTSGDKGCVLKQTDPDPDPVDPCDGIACQSGETCRQGLCVDDGSTDPDPDPDPDNTPDAGVNPDTGGQDSGPNDPDQPDAGEQSDAGDQADAGDKTIDQNQEEEAGGDGAYSYCGCASTPMKDDVPASLMLLGAFGLGVFWRRRR